MSVRSSFLYLKRVAAPKSGDRGNPLFQRAASHFPLNSGLLDPLPCLDCQFIQGEEEDGHESNDRQGEVKAESRLRPLGLFFSICVGRVVMRFDSDEVVSSFFSAPKWFFA